MVERPPSGGFFVKRGIEPNSWAGGRRMRCYRGRGGVCELDAVVAFVFYCILPLALAGGD